MRGGNEQVANTKAIRKAYDDSRNTICKHRTKTVSLIQVLRGGEAVGAISPTIRSSSFSGRWSSQDSPPRLPRTHSSGQKEGSPSAVEGIGYRPARKSTNATSMRLESAGKEEPTNRIESNRNETTQNEINFNFRGRGWCEPQRPQRLNVHNYRSTKDISKYHKTLH